MNKLIALCLISIVTISSYGQSSDVITVDGEVTRPLKISVADLAKFKSAEVKAKDKSGKEHVYSGTYLSTVLDSAGVTLGKELHGENLSKYILVSAADGYKVVYSIAEVDPQMTSNNVLLAIKVDGAPLPKGEGPFRLVAPNDKRPARWIREITAIKVVFAK